MDEQANDITTASLPETPQEPSFGSDQDGLREAAGELIKSREESIDRQGLEPGTPEQPTFAQQDAEPETDHIHYIDPKTGEPIPDHEKTVTVKQAARDLAAYHAASEALKAEGAAQAVSQQEATPDLPAAPVEQPVQPSPQPAPVQDPVQQLEQFRQGIAAQEQHDIAQLGQLSALFPEYVAAGSNAEQLQRLAQSNPQRHQLFLQANQEAGRLRAELIQINQAKSATAEQLQRAQHQQYAAWVNAENDKVDAAIPDEAERDRLGREVVAMLKERGISAKDIDLPQYRMLRSAEGQLFLAESARLRLQQRAQQEGAKRLSAHQKPVPPVVRPGTAPAHPRDGRIAADIDRLSHNLDAARSPQAAIRAAVELRKAQRAAR